MSNHFQILKKPLVTEKSTQLLADGNWVCFRVDSSANKIQVKQAVEKIFNVTVLQVNTMVVSGKNRRFGQNVGRTKPWKKAMLRLKEGDKIDLFEGA
ncbi:MAG: 50S ribosomal protein L23 [Nitrospinaceae bacterium]|jgi:large subunit ribosomal protein L23|nr:50S ribosomal protein L23 [Nitrospinaceae bacterium]|tara:strand:- start:254 stop:544 length:291 start_codon:yes stop_codon:yes gene_type:complete